ncbi:MAG: hypothetical protein OXH07_05855 [Chloroflexi bacterium]|nr:hypothetical protein [Chloroflexota bacterium]
MSFLVERAMEWAEEAMVVTAKLFATAVLLPFALWLPGPEFLIARMWGKSLTDDD